MADIILIACGSKKRSHESEAQFMYISPLFRKSRDYAILSANHWYILSGKYGLLRPDSIIRPYDLSLKHLDKREQRTWAKRVLESLQQVARRGDTVTFLAGLAYRRNLVPKLRELGYSIDTPLEGMSIGKQMKWLNTKVDKVYSDLNRFYEILSDLEVGLGGKRRLGECNGTLSWPRRGVYFFFEQSGIRKGWPAKQRVVRVGTHAVSDGSRSTLWKRLRAHKGSFDGGGNHRSSIFRLHVGEALLNKEHNRESIPSWGKDMYAPSKIRSVERGLEEKVSKYLSEMLLLWIDVEDSPSPSSDRAYIEKNAIALLSNFQHPFDPPGARWLGNYSTSDSIRCSGLWNIQHTMEKYDAKFLDILSTYVDITLGRKPKPNGSIAPKWHRLDAKESKGFQPSLDRFGGKE